MLIKNTHAECYTQTEGDRHEASVLGCFNDDKQWLFGLVAASVVIQSIAGPLALAVQPQLAPCKSVPHTYLFPAAPSGPTKAV